MRALACRLADLWGWSVREIEMCTTTNQPTIISIAEITTRRPRVLRVFVCVWHSNSQHTVRSVPPAKARARALDRVPFAHWGVTRFNKLQHTSKTGCFCPTERRRRRQDQRRGRGGATHVAWVLCMQYVSINWRSKMKCASPVYVARSQHVPTARQLLHTLCVYYWDEVIWLMLLIAVNMHIHRCWNLVWTVHVSTFFIQFYVTWE